MVRKIVHGDRKDAIRAELLLRASEGRTIFYEELGRMLAIPTRGPWKPVLDEISREETGKGLPDITFLVISKRTGTPRSNRIQARHATDRSGTKGGRRDNSESICALSAEKEFV
jgi:hypothetical protein